jgi:hypothetical protein
LANLPQKRMALPSATAAKFASAFPYRASQKSASNSDKVTEIPIAVQAAV